MARRGENIYKRKDGRWEARIIKGYDKHGKALYAYFYGRTYKEVKDKVFSAVSCAYDEQVAAFSETDYAPYFEKVLDLWLENSRIKLKISSYAKYFNLINNHIKPLLGKYPITAITSALLSNYAAEKLTTGKCDSSGGLSEKTVKDIMTIIKSVLKYANDEAFHIDANIQLNLPREKSKVMRVLSQNEQSALEKFLLTDMNLCKLGILLCLYTGLRIGEICALKWIDIAVDEGTLCVSRTMQRIQALDTYSSTKTKVFITDPKSECSLRIIPLPDAIIEILQRFRPDNPNAYFLTGRTEYYIEPRTYQNRFKSYILLCGLKDANFHALRHTFATRCVEVGFELKSLSTILGHANIKITLDRYVHPSFDLKRLNMNKLNSFLEYAV